MEQAGHVEVAIAALHEVRTGGDVLAATPRLLGEQGAVVVGVGVDPGQIGDVVRTPRRLGREELHCEQFGQKDQIGTLGLIEQPTYVLGEFVEVVHRTDQKVDRRDGDGVRHG